MRSVWIVLLADQSAPEPPFVSMGRPGHGLDPELLPMAGEVAPDDGVVVSLTVSHGMRGAHAGVARHVFGVEGLSQCLERGLQRRRINLAQQHCHHLLAN